MGIPLEERCFLISLSVPYQLNLGVECPILGRWTLAACTERALVACSYNHAYNTPAPFLFWANFAILWRPVLRADSLIPESRPSFSRDCATTSASCSQCVTCNYNKDLGFLYRAHQVIPFWSAGQVVNGDQMSITQHEISHASSFFIIFLRAWRASHESRKKTSLAPATRII